MRTDCGFSRVWLKGVLAVVAAVAVGCAKDEAATADVAVAADGADGTADATDATDADGADATDADGADATDADGADATDADGADATDADGVDGNDIVLPPADVVDDTGGQVTTPDTCRSALLCATLCNKGDDACADACKAADDATIATRIDAIDACTTTACPEASNGSALWSCRLGNCWEPLHACLYDNKSGAGTCKDAVTCIRECKDPYPFDDFDDVTLTAECEDGCMQAQTKDDQLNFAKFAFCVSNWCNDFPAENCEKQAACGTQEELCQKPI